MMKSVFRISMFILLIFLNNFCKKDKPILPILSTSNVRAIGHLTAISGGNTANWLEAKILSDGVCWSRSEMPTISDNKTLDGTTNSNFKSLLTGLSGNTIYYVRAYATKSVGTGYGEQIQFTTADDYTGQTGKVYDVDGNVYKTIGIGSQIWFTENLKTTGLNNAAPIQNVTSDSLWYYSVTPAYCWYDNDSTNKSIYGALYNWLTVNTGYLCPSGWHIPDQDEWYILIDDLGGSSVAGGKLKEIGTTHWVSPNLDATNETNFTALPGGSRTDEGQFNGIGGVGLWWSSTVYPTLGQGREAGYIHIGADLGIVPVETTGFIWQGFSARCVKNH